MSKRILITDDALFMRVALKTMLTANGYEVVGEAVNGQDAVEQYVVCRPDLVLMDITMPIMDGITACRAIKEGRSERQSRHVYSDGSEKHGHGSPPGRGPKTSSSSLSRQSACWKASGN